MPPGGVLVIQEPCREGSLMMSLAHLHGFSESYSDYRSGHGKEQVDAEFSPMIAKFDIKLLHKKSISLTLYGFIWMIAGSASGVIDKADVSGDGMVAGGAGAIPCVEAKCVLE
jgi:hypothetical protein